MAERIVLCIEPDGATVAEIRRGLGSHGFRIESQPNGDEAIAAPQRRVVNGREIYFGTAPGVFSAAYRDRGIGYVATSDLDEDALTRLLAVSLSQ